MARNHEVTDVHPLIDEAGELREPGWSRSLVQQSSMTVCQCMYVT